MVINAVELALPNNANKQTDQRQDSYGHRGTGDHRSDRACRDFARGSCNYNNCSFRHAKGDQDRQTGRDKDKRDNERSRESNNSSNQRQREDNNQKKASPDTSTAHVFSTWTALVSSATGAPSRTTPQKKTATRAKVKDC